MPSKNRVPDWQENFGFTLLELSLVMVIIGLIAGGILAGKELIHTAMLQKQIKQINDYTIAYNVFKDKYKCMPGDCANANSFFTNTDNGNGDSLIQSNDTNHPELNNLNHSADGVFDFEQSGFFEHLQAAGLIIEIKTTGTGYPQSVLSSGKGFSAASDFSLVASNYVDSFTSQSKTYFAKGEWRAGLYFAMGNTNPAEDPNDVYGLFTPLDTYYMDNKMDDGNPQTGKFLAGTIEWTNYDDGNDGYCLDNSPYANNIYSGVRTMFEDPEAKMETYLLTNPETPCVFAWRLE